ncbi:nuclear GTPase-like protein [Perkinsela sp. CCAP 1560/4]|nr:nuclear GTPase-like protein [Perkinsela sp. CCAP 1560/4]|eukprot:KNH09539.1 nuclear GTPase-like protein [Perkinsela sp. CCAP 1560/4]
MKKKKSTEQGSSKRAADLSLHKIRCLGNSLLKVPRQMQENNKCMRNAPRGIGLPCASSFQAASTGSAPLYNPRIDAARISLVANQKQVDFKSAGSVLPHADDDHAKQNMGSRHLKRIYHQQFTQVVDASDILLEVLDARDPLSCRLVHFEKLIYGKYGRKKTIFLLLNKIDLIPPEIALLWKNHFDSEGITSILFCTGKVSRYASPSGFTSKSGTDLAANCVDIVFREIRRISKTEFGVHKSITVGVVGLPNVGKSSVINALRRRDVLAVSAHPGSTKSTTTVDLKKTVKILDCPGIINVESMNETWEKSINDFILVNAIKVNDVTNPIGAFEYIVEKVGPQVIADHFCIEIVEGESSYELLERVGRAQGKLLPGGMVDSESAAKTFLHHWSMGKIRFYTLPPDEDGGKTYHIGTVSASRSE